MVLRSRCGQCGAFLGAPVAASPAPVIPIRPDVAKPAPVAAIAPKTSTDVLAAAEARLAEVEALLANHDAMKREAKQLRRMIAAFKRG